MSNVHHRRTFRWLAGSVLLAPTAWMACAGQPAPKTAIPLAKTAAPIVHLLCHDGVRRVDFAAVGVPQGEKPAGVAITPRYVWVLFHPARLLRIERGGGSTVQMLVGGEGEAWNGLDVDPLDGSLWIGEEHPMSLHHVTEGLRLASVKLQRVQGDGSFLSLLAARDALYLHVSGESQVWRFDRSGRFLDKAFPGHPEEPSAEPRRLGGGSSHLVHAADGGILFWDGVQGRAFSPDARGAWAPSEVHWFDGEPSSSRAVQGAGVGTQDEMWFLYDGGYRSLFFWKGQPVFLSSHANGLKESAVVLVVPAPGGGEPRALLDACGRAYVLDVASDATGYAALRQEDLVMDDFATSPDLP